MIRHASVARSFSFALVLFSLTACTASQEATAPDPSSSEVNVGYGAQDRDVVTGAVASVDVEEAQKQSATHVQDLLQGRVAGVNVYTAPDGSLAVRIRGTSSLYGSNEPLYVLDGMPMTTRPGGGLTGLNPQDIASIEVLKDAGSTAIYGSRGANGVVIIKTKRGR